MTLAEIRLRPNILIACILRGHKLIIPSGSDHIEAGDTVIVVTNTEQVLSNLNEIFAGEEARA